ncbi:hypothetical protein ACFT2C_24495 [Promicromonospora sp. NPDC057138]|uniref:hypothetical protein n=1 Tax=Promicromonospora sp. NPDC057138 TaxID=3346031 RepID=UPI00362699C2
MRLVPAAVLAAIFASLVQALLSPPLHTGDETAHLDYAYQVWTGHLPVFEDGLVLAPEAGSVPPVQWAAQHPPLYYVVLAPVVGPLVDGGHIVAAVYAARGLNVLGAGALVLVAAWAARRAFPASPLVAPVTALVVGATAWVARVGGSGYNDILAALLTTWLLGLAASSVRSGLTWPRAAGLIAVSALCLGSRLHTVVMVGVLVAAVLAGVVLRTAGLHDGRGEAVRAVVVALGVPAAVAATSGWFYLRNVALTGSVTGGHPDWAAQNLDRAARPVTDVLADAGVWTRLLAVFGHDQLPDVAVVLVLLVAPAALAVAAGIRTVRDARLPATERADVLILVTGATAVAATLAMQLVYTAGGGSPHPRYLLPVIGILAMLVAHGLVSTRRWLPWAAGLWCAVPLIDQAVWVAVSAPRYAGTWPDGSLSVTGAWVAWGATCVAVAVAVAGLAVARRRTPAPAV